MRYTAIHCEVTAGLRRALNGSAGGFGVASVLSPPFPRHAFNEQLPGILSPLSWRAWCPGIAGVTVNQDCSLQRHSENDHVIVRVVD